MKRYITAVLLVVGALTLSACGEQVEVPPAHQGMILGKNGYNPDIIAPSKFRLPWCVRYCDKLIVAEISDQGVREQFTLLMPKDQLVMSFDLRGTFSIDSNQDKIAQIFDRVTSQRVDDSRFHGYISFDQVYETYGQQVIRGVVRSVLSRYSIDEIANNRERVTAELSESVVKGLKHTPIKAIRVELADVQYPKVITEAKEEAVKRKIDIEKAESAKAVRLIELERELEEARAQRNIRKEKAQAILEENEIIARSVTPDYIAYKKLEVLESMANSPNTVFVPFEALGTVGLENKIFNPPQ